MSNYYFKKGKTFRSRKKEEMPIVRAIRQVFQQSGVKLRGRSGSYIEKDLGVVERFRTAQGRSRRGKVHSFHRNSASGNVLSVVLIIILLLFLWYLFFMQQSHMVFKRMSRNFIKDQLSVWSYVGKEGDFSKSFILKMSSDNEELDYLLRNSRIRLDVDTLSKTKISQFYLNYLGQDVVEFTTTYNNGKLGLQSLTSDEPDYFTTDIDRFITTITNEDLDMKDYLDTKVTGAMKRKLLKKYSDVILSVANSQNISVSKNKEIVLDALDDSFKGKIYTLKPSAKEMEAMILELGSSIRKDEDLRKLLKSSGMELELLTSNSYQTMPAFLRTKDVDVLVSDISNFLVDHAKDIANELETGGFRCEIGVYSNRIMYINLAFDDSDGLTKSFVFESIEKDKVKRQAYLFSNMGDNATISVIHRFKKDKRQISGDAEVFINGANAWNIRYDFDKSKKTLLLPEGEYVLDALVTGETMDLRIAKFSEKQTEYKLERSGVSEGKGGRWTLELTEEDIGRLELPTTKPRDMDMMSGSEYKAVLDSLEYGITKHILALLGYQVNP